MLASLLAPAFALRASAGFALFLGALLFATTAWSQKFYPDDPLFVDRDDLPVEKPGLIELSPTYDLLENTFAGPEIEDPIPRAGNVNTLGEVPDSSWFQNRIGIRDLSPAEIARGPNGSGPPIPPLTVVAAKASGITPGFTARDDRGETFFVKFDPAEHPNLSTGADVVAKSFFHAIGYNVPEAYIVYLRSDDLRVDPDAEIRLQGGGRARLDEEFVRHLLDAAAHHPDGSTRAVASLAVPGEVLGPFKFHGTRPDDPNDIVPHEHRRELRGYRVFCAWLNHDDSRALNTLDAYESDGAAGAHVRHYLIDFGSTLGSGSDYLRRIAPQDRRSGYEYILDLDPIWKAAYTFGIKDRAWRDIPYAYPRFAEVGRIEADAFEPHRWKPEYPNAAFQRMLADDAFWAAKIVARFSDEAIRAVVAAGDYLSEDAERYLADTLIRRRDKVLSHYFRELNPLDGFSVTGALEFANLGVERGLGKVDGYEYQWFSFDNGTGRTTPLNASGHAPAARIDVPESDAPYLMVRIRSRAPTAAGWKKAVDVYLRGREVVGIEREL